ncbi:putative sterol regulatory element-binding protein [Podospora australis]|uniref:Sterol regulatory element-binding protein cleavage-activating protein n=1 Tax=Podospora australis TaxID=1536484 RepID=A0AAN7APH4_9PEZI|nr:putative sterol regulatory element-binding protein [Podospora australis]
MIWYLLYPLRGTTEVPVLAATHPLRTAFSRYAKYTACHVRTVLTIATAVIFFFLYLLPFLYTSDATNITSGVSKLPHHVWTDAQPLGDGAMVEPDVIMRPIWIHGSYMKALERDVLLGALDLQDELLGPTTNFNPRQPTNTLELPDTTTDLTPQQRDTFHIVNGLTDQSWFFHSPLQYWSGSRENILADQDILATVNAGKTQSTSVNVTLRHSIVFSGKRFEERRLVAADALVITLIHLRNSPVGRQWVRKAEALAAERADMWKIIPADGKSHSNQLYDFQFRPLSWTDWVLLTIAYCFTLLYLLSCLAKIRAVKSRLGLMVTILVQIIASIGSSFSVCAIFKIDLSRIPSYAYPLVVLAISMENSFRLINAVIVTSSTISNSDRIGEAFGATAHIAIANRVQNLLILWGLSRITFPGVAAWCAFAAIATMFDFFYLSTFFLSVLSLDVRQRELVELEKASLKRTKSAESTSQKMSYVDTFRQFRLGETAVSTRIAGTIVLIGFVLIAQSHYAPEGRRHWLNQIFSLSWRKAVRGAPKSSLLIDIHQARSPTSWLRLQDHETAREVIKVVKPTAHSYVARVYDPIVFVLKGSDRIPRTREPMLLPAVYDFIHREIPGFVVTLLMVVAGILLFANYLLKDEYPNDGGPEHPEDEPLISVRTLSKGHNLDVAMMAAAPGGQLVSVGLDRSIQIWNVLSGSKASVLCDHEVPLENPFPVLNMAIDQKSKWLALVSWQRVYFWSILNQQWTGTKDIDLCAHKPEAVFFKRKPESAPSLVIVRKNGTGLEIPLDGSEAKEFSICKTPLIWAVPFADKSHHSHHRSSFTSILTASRKSCIHLVRQQDNEWVSTEVDLGESESKGVHCVLPLPSLSMYLIGRSKSVDLVDLDTSTIIHTFSTEPMKPRSLKQISLTRSQQSCLTSLTLAYVSMETGELVLQTYLPEDEDNLLCSYTPAEFSSTVQRGWGPSKEIKRHIANPGVWEALASGSIIGVREKLAPTRPRSASSASSSSSSSGPIGLRRRGVNRTDDHPDNATRCWEAWVINHPEANSELETRQLDIPDAAGVPDGGHLLISEVGPMVKLGAMSVAVGFGNVVKVISAGHEYFDQVSDGLGAESLLNLGSRRKKANGRANGHNLRSAG